MQLPRQNPNHLSILVVEDCEATNLMIQEAIGHEYLMTHVWTVQDAHLALSRQAFDLILLDVTLPDGTGFNFAEQLQHSQHNPPPFIFITGHTDLTDRIRGLKIGADDYITKPFNTLELQARVEANLRRSGRFQATPRTVEPQFPITFDPERLRVQVSFQGPPISIELTPIEFRLLKSLVAGKGDILARGDLIRQAWGEGVHVMDRTVDRHISSLRHKLGNSRTIIEAVPGEGYRFSLS